MPQLVFVDGKINTILDTIIHDRAAGLNRLDHYRSINSLIQQAGKIFGNEMTYVLADHKSGFRFSLEIFREGSYENNPYLDAEKGLIFRINIGPQNWYAAEDNYDLTVFMPLRSEIAREVTVSLAKDNNHKTARYFSMYIARAILKKYQQRLARFNKKFDFKKTEAATFANALELYSGYALSKKADLNVVNYLARSVKGGMNSQKAVWMVYNRHSVSLAEDFKDVPTSWVIEI